jgi:hypothetical protein
VIDQILLDLIRIKLGGPADLTRDAILRTRIRILKESLFREGVARAPDGGAEVTISEFERDPAAKALANEITRTVRELMNDARVRLDVFSQRELTITFVGGGASIGLLRRAVQRGVNDYSGPRFHITVSPAPAMANLPSSPERLAVALGGIAPKSGWPETRMKEPTSYRGILR